MSDLSASGEPFTRQYHSACDDCDRAEDDDDEAPLLLLPAATAVEVEVVAAPLLGVHCASTDMRCSAEEK